MDKAELVSGKPILLLNCSEPVACLSHNTDH